MKSAVFATLLASASAFMVANPKTATPASSTTELMSSYGRGYSNYGGIQALGPNAPGSRPGERYDTNRYGNGYKSSTSTGSNLPQTGRRTGAYWNYYNQGRAAGAFPMDEDYRRRVGRDMAPYGRSRREYRGSQSGRYQQQLIDNEILVQGNTLKTWTFNSPVVERVMVDIGTEGRPFDAEVDLWQGPDNTPQKMRVYSENGELRPFQVLLETPRAPNTVAIRNVGQMEFPMIASVAADVGRGSIPMASNMWYNMRTIQGGALRTYPFDPSVDSVQILLTTDGRPLTARVELLQGPNNNKQVIELYCEDGMDRPFYVVIETPGSGNVVRLVNTATVEFPMWASIEAYQIGGNNKGDYMEPILGDGAVFNQGVIGQW